MERLTLRHPRGSTNVVVGAGALGDVGDELSALCKHVTVIARRHERPGQEL